MQTFQNHPSITLFINYNIYMKYFHISKILHKLNIYESMNKCKLLKYDYGNNSDFNMWTYYVIKHFAFLSLMTL